MKKKSNFLTLVGIVICGVVYGQTDSHVASHNVRISVPSVILVDIEGGTTFDLGFTAPIEAGLGLTAPTSNNSLWLNYTSVITAAGQTRKISVKVDEVIPGADLTVSAAAATAHGMGTKGISETLTTPITLSAADQVIIDGIASAYTDNGSSRGHNLTYNLVANSTDFGSLVAQTNTVIEVTYTIAAN